MPGGIVTSLEILDANQGMGYRGYKSDSLISVKEQRVDGSSIYFFIYIYKIYVKKKLASASSSLEDLGRVAVKLMVRCTLVAGKPVLG